MSDNAEKSDWMIFRRIGVILLISSIAFIVVEFLMGLDDMIFFVLGLCLSSAVIIIFTTKLLQNCDQESESETTPLPSDASELVCPWCHRHHPRDSDLEEEEVDAYCSATCSAGHLYYFLMMASIVIVITLISFSPLFLTTLNYFGPFFFVAILGLFTLSPIPIFYLTYLGHKARDIKGKYSHLG